MAPTNAIEIKSFENQLLQLMGGNGFFFVINVYLLFSQY